MAEIVLATLNAKYIHASLALRYLLANLDDLQPQTALLEFEISQRPLDIVESILQHNPRVVGFGVYIWNTAPTAQVVLALKRLRPELTVILGGPEVSYETDQQPIVNHADYVITGEADLAFAALCRAILAGSAPAAKIVHAPLPDLADIRLPYSFYTDDDVAHRILYVEASRGCPFSCEFCLSSLDIPVRQFHLPDLLDSFERLLARGTTHFKFVDRTFNLNLATATRLLDFFHTNYRPGLFLHFEMIPDRLPEPVRQRITRFPPGALQFEIGIQSLNPEVSERISRRQDFTRIEENFRFLREETGVHIHADLIAGLPGETLDSFAAGFDWLLALRPHEIQVGILKRLRGTPIIRHDDAFEMIYSSDPPYEILQNKHLDFPTMQRLRRFARYWDLIYNSGRFRETAALIWNGHFSAFNAFMDWSEWLYRQAGTRHGIALNRLANFLFQYLTQELGLAPVHVKSVLRSDFARNGRTDTPPFLKSPDAPIVTSSTLNQPTPAVDHPAPILTLPLPRHSRRQQRHRPLP